MANREKTIYAALKRKLQREPTHNELATEVKRILEDGAAIAAVIKVQPRKVSS